MKYQLYGQQWYDKTTHVEIPGSSYCRIKNLNTLLPELC